MPPLKDRVGQRFGRLVVLKKAERDPGACHTDAMWLCQCDCGRRTTVRSSSLATGNTLSCGCLHKEKMSDMFSLPPGVSSLNRVLHAYKKGADERGLAWRLSDKMFFDLIGQSCHYCGSPPSRRVQSWPTKNPILCNGVDRMNNNVGYVPGNCVPCCKRCNMAKRASSYEDFTEWLDRVAVFRSQPQ